ncbi:MAG TPA: putative LPS assembly protein LptD [Gemmatimonadota bacterium]|nr:putative LPS assembly protein LptD [Gemmatimonadota bacterium]
MPQDTTPVVRPRREPQRPPAPRLPPGQLPDSLTRPGQDKQVPEDSAGRAAVLDEGEPFPASDSIIEALLLRSGYRPVLYRGDTLQFSTRDRSIHIRERAHIERGGDQYYADSVVYEGQTHYVTGFGNMRLINAKGQEVNSDSGPLYYDTDRRIGTIKNSKTQWEIWHVAGDFTLEGTDTLWVKSGHFTTCDLPEAHYRFEADKIKLILGNIVVAWPVRVYFGDVPVFWFPFMAQDIRRGRHSGLLTMQFGVTDIVRNSNRARHISNIGYYWAISDYMDAQLSMDWWSSQWTRFDGFYRYKWVQKFIDGGVGYSHFLLPNGGRELSFSWNHRQQFGERSDLRASVQYVSNKTFQQSAEYNPERLTQKIRSDIGFTRRFDWGNLSLSGQRIQPISETGEVTTTTLPQLSITLAPIVLTPARSPLEARWYNGLTWTGSTSFNHRVLDAPVAADQRDLSGSLSSNFSLGNLSWSSRASYNEVRIDRPDTLFIDTDTLIIGDQVRTGTLAWNTSLGYRQRLIGTTTLTPSLDVSGQYFRSNLTDFSFISEPTRLAARATLNSDVYGFFPGFGPIERIRHKFSPNLSWSYSPEVKPDPDKEAILGSTTFAERHSLTIGLNQTFEAKLKPREEPEPAEPSITGEAGAESAGLESAALEQAAEQGTGPGQETGGGIGQGQSQEDRKLTLLAIRTSAVVYDFVEHEFTTTTLSNSMTSDLLRGLEVRVVHDLFRPARTVPGGDLPELCPGCDLESEIKRAFDPYLTQLNVSFSIGERTLAALLGRGIAGQQGIVPEVEPFEDLEEEAALRDEVEAERAGAAESGRRTPWSLNVNYSLLRSRPVPGSQSEPRQTVALSLGFSPTRNWTLSWRTTYDIESGEFVDQVLNFRRDLHRWAATFQFLKAANGNITFNFSVHLKDLRDLEFDYRQETRRAQG